jgi:pyruvate, water dikinase
MSEEEKKPGQSGSLEQLMHSLHERVKELNCMYRVEEILSGPMDTSADLCRELVQAIPSGWQYPDICRAEIVLDGQTHTAAPFEETPWVQSAEVKDNGRVVGYVRVCYLEARPLTADGPFLRDETKLLQHIAERLGHRVAHLRIRSVLRNLQMPVGSTVGGEWNAVLEMIRQTDHNLFLSLSRKMLNHLCVSGVAEADQLLQSLVHEKGADEEGPEQDWNRPHEETGEALSDELGGSTFAIAGRHMTDDQILKHIQRWVQEDKLSFLVQTLSRNVSLNQVVDAVRRYHYLALEEPLPLSPSHRGILVSLIRRFLSGQLTYINIAKQYMSVQDFHDLLQHVVFSSESQGRLGGKSAGMYLAAQVLRSHCQTLPLLGQIKLPKTWHVTSDVVLQFMHHNNFDEIIEQKYKEVDQVRLEYPYVVRMFKSGRFPDEIVKGLSVALDDLGDCPIIVRSSSLLEDRAGSAFSGKYKSLFLANQGSKRERLHALKAAIAEVYASTFGPDPVEYRAERGLLDFQEEMGIIIQQVVGTRVGRYFLPAFAGVAFSHNEFRWSPRIQRKDGLVRIVPGLGTRAVDRLADDYPILVAPGNPRLRANISADEIARYSPQKIDVIDLEANRFETIEFGAFLADIDYRLPLIADIVSIYEDDHIRRPLSVSTDFSRHELVASFDGLIERTPFVSQMQAILKTLEEALGTPVDIEFAHDGQDLYLLQCRTQAPSKTNLAAPIPRDIPRDRIIFSANRYVSNGWVPDVTHIIYVDPERYGELADRSQLLAVGRAVGRLNKLLPKRKFILMGPGRWGSRGDIKLGVSVTYSDINNTAALIEIARLRGGYVPDLSFGTHFFQDLVEADIRYLPLYPDDAGVVFNERFLTGSPNALAEFLPDCVELADALRVIDVPKVSDGQVLHLLLNAELDEALALLIPPGFEEKHAVTGARTAQDARQG